MDDVRPVAKKVAKHDSGAADLEKVTDFEEEREISSQDIADVSHDRMSPSVHLIV